MIISQCSKSKTHCTEAIRGIFFFFLKGTELWHFVHFYFTLAFPMALRACDCSCSVMWDTESATTSDLLWNMCSTACRQTHTASLTSCGRRQATPTTSVRLSVCLSIPAHLDQLHQSTQCFDWGLGHGPLHRHVHVHGGSDNGADAVCIQDTLEQKVSNKSPCQWSKYLLFCKKIINLD